MRPPLPDNYTLRMDAAAWTETLIVVEEDKYVGQMILKEALLSGEDRDYYIQCPPQAEPLAWEALELLLIHAAQDWPQHFALTQTGDHWTWTNRLREDRFGGTQSFRLGDPAALPCPVLDWLGHQFQEDLVLMGRLGGDQENQELVCVGGQLCFGSGWSLGDKMGKAILEVHAEVPGFQGTVGKATEGLLRRLKAGRPVGRWNWTLPPTDRLNLAPALAHEWATARQEITPENAGSRCFVRAERQTLSRLPRTGGVLFTIHTYRAPVQEIAADPLQRRRLLRYVSSIPAETQTYRGMASYAGALVAYLTRAPE